MTVIYAAPSTRPMRRAVRTDRPDSFTWAFDLQTAINRAGPGDVIELLPGRYGAPVTLTVSGRADAPITLRGPAGGGAVLDGGRRFADGRQGGFEPVDSDFAMLKFFRCAHIRLENLHFENAWPSAMFIRGAHHITLSGCSGVGGRYFVYARQSDAFATHHLTLEDCTWVQDPDHDMWTGRVAWDDIKSSVAFDASYLNGAFLGGFDIQGQIIIRRCTVSHAFNAVRLDARASRMSPDLHSTRNRDVAIYDNSFSFIRDNAIEPETAAQNWHVFNNRFYAVHGVFSLDHVASRDLFYVANWILNDHRPGLFDPTTQASVQQAQGGKIFKLFKPEPGKDPKPRAGLYSLFNSVQSRTAYVKKGITRHWLDAFTLLGLYPTEHPQLPTGPRHPLDRLIWDDVQIKQMVCDAVGFPKDHAPDAAGLTGNYVTRVFEPVQGTAPATPKLGAVLGGWDGALIPSQGAALFRSSALEIETAQGLIAFADKRPLGAQDVAELGLGHWRDPWPDETPLVG